MRSDYYGPVDSGEPRPLIPLPRQPRRKKRALPLFLLFLLLILSGGAGLLWQFGWPGQWDAPEIVAPYFRPLNVPKTEKTTILTLAPPGQGTMTLLQEPEEPMSPKEVYASLSPSVLAVTALNSNGGGSEGTGVIFDQLGYFVTNAHVIEGAGKVEVTLFDGRRYPAYLIGMDAQTDLAVLKFSAPNLTSASFASDTTLAVGDLAYAIGNPLGSQFRGSMTDGIISGINRNVTVGEYDMSLIQTSAAINTGSSGGALADSAGRVVGITNMKMMSWSSTVEGLGFAIPSTTVEKVVNQLMRTGRVTRAMLGITVRPLLLEEGGGDIGLMAEDVNRRSDAWAKGIRPGHILLAANGIPLRKNQDLLDQKDALVPGDSITLIWLDPQTGDSYEAEVVLAGEYDLE